MPDLWGWGSKAVLRQNPQISILERRGRSIRRQTEDLRLFEGGGLHPRTSPLQGHSGATREDGECAGWVDLQPRSKVRRGGLRLGRQTDVAMMEATDFVKLHDPARVGEFN
jgi:hypothetical protein